MNVAVHNMAAMNAGRQLKINSRAKAKSAEKLSTGYKINRSADDAAGLSISEKMRHQIRGLSRGTENAQDGISLCQVVDGALAEVDDMLHRITELSVQSANGTNSDTDRQAIQEEVEQILREIDKIGDTTVFNERRIFSEDGSVEVYSGDRTGEISSEKVAVLKDVDLGVPPIRAGERANIMHLQAEVQSASNESYKMLYGNGSTSNPSIRFSSTASGAKEVVELSAMNATGNSDYSGTNNTWWREFQWTSADGSESVTLKQTIRLEKTSAAEQNYVISYEFTTSSGVSDLEFLFDADTAYNNDDQCEGYYINGSRVNHFCAYSKSDAEGGSVFTDSMTSSYVYKNGIPDSISIIDAEKPLSFTEKISFDGADKPDSFVIGEYDGDLKWSETGNLSSNYLGGSTSRNDIIFLLYYNLGDASQGKTVTFKYGITAVEQDENIGNLLPEEEEEAAEDKKELSKAEQSLWIQSGNECGSGMRLAIGTMNTKRLGIDELDVSTVAGADTAMEDVDGALKRVSEIRSTIGAQQNRLESMIANQENTVENTTAAESRIRDTDMAEEMLEYSKNNILSQAGQSMLAQANQSADGILTLLQ